MFGNDPKKYELLALVRYMNGGRDDTLAYVRELNSSKNQKKVACVSFDGLPSYFLDNARDNLDLAVTSSSSLISVDFNSERISEKPFAGMKLYGSLSADSEDIFERDLALWTQRKQFDEDFKIGKDRNNKLLQQFVVNDPYASMYVFCQDGFLSEGSNYVALKDAVVDDVRSMKSRENNSYSPDMMHRAKPDYGYYDASSYNEGFNDNSFGY